MKEKKKIEYSKILATSSLLIFLITLFSSIGFVVYLMLFAEVTLIDTAIFATALTITGGIYGMTARHYYNKAGLENCSNIRKGVYAEILKNRLEYNKEMIKLKNKYELSDDDISEIELDNPFVSMSDEALGRINNKIDESDETNSTDVEIETY